MSDDLSRREFVLASLATAVVGCRSSESEKPLVRFGMEDYRPGNFDFRDTNVPPHETKWLQGVIDSAPGPVVVFAHQLFDPTCDERMRIKNAPELREMFEKSGKVKVVFSATTISATRLNITVFSTTRCGRWRRMRTLKTIALPKFRSTIRAESLSRAS